MTVIGHFVSIPCSNISLQARFAKIVRGLRHDGSAAGMPLIDPSVTVETVLAYSESKLTERESSTDQPRYAGYNTLILLRVYCGVCFRFINIMLVLVYSIQQTLSLVVRPGSCGMTIFEQVVEGI